MLILLCTIYTMCWYNTVPSTHFSSHADTGHLHGNLSADTIQYHLHTYDYVLIQIMYHLHSTHADTIQYHLHMLHHIMLIQEVPSTHVASHADTGSTIYTCSVTCWYSEYHLHSNLCMSWYSALSHIGYHLHIVLYTALTCTQPPLISDTAQR